MTRRLDYQVIAKPIGPLCNLDCRYCFYLEKEALLGKGSLSQRADWMMVDAVLEAYISQKLNSPAVDQHFLWQGGEPTLLGLGFFEKVVTIQKRYGAGKRIHNAIQTNGVLLDEDWARFLARHEFLVGLSIDGPREMHDAYRRFKGGNSSFDQTLAALERLKIHEVEFNTLTTVHAGNQHAGREVYRFLKSLGAQYQQYIPIVERTDPRDSRALATPEMDQAPVTAWSVGAKAYGEFLINIFDEWVRQDVGNIFVQNFDLALEAWLGRPSSLCVFRETCGLAPALEHNGELFSCDHYVYPDHKLGNILGKDMATLLSSTQQQRFGLAKRELLPEKCRACTYRFACHGGCPKQRFIATAEKGHALNYLCPGYLIFFEHVDPALRFMATEIKERRPPSSIMQTFDLRGAPDENHP